MNRRITWGILLILGVAAVMWHFTHDEDPTSGLDEATAVKKQLDRLPYEIAMRNRAIVFDRSSIGREPRESYARLPYEINIGEETRLVESEADFLTGETPIDFMERLLADLMPPEEELDAYPETVYRYSVSFHPIEKNLVSEYPTPDRPDTEPAEEGLSAYIRTMNYPDDSIGGSERRYDFLVIEDGAWILAWQGHRNFCRRPDREFWQPADQLCP